jgi:hypothetical protein
MIEVITDFNGQVIQGKTPEDGDIVRRTTPRGDLPPYIEEFYYHPPGPPPPPPPPEPVRVSKIDFFRLFTQAENAAFNRKRKETQLLAPADYADPTKALIVAFEVFLNLFDATDTIELNNEDTVNGVNLLAALGIIAPTRVVQVLAGTKP